MGRRWPRLPPPSESRLASRWRDATHCFRFGSADGTRHSRLRRVLCTTIPLHNFVRGPRRPKVTPAKGYATLCCGTADEADARYLATARADRLPPDPAGTARHVAGQSRLPLQSILRALPRQCRPSPNRGDDGRDRERKVDQRDQEALARELELRDRPGRRHQPDSGDSSRPFCSIKKALAWS